MNTDARRRTTITLRSSLPHTASTRQDSAGRRYRRMAASRPFAQRATAGLLQSCQRRRRRRNTLLGRRFAASGVGLRGANVSGLRGRLGLGSWLLILHVREIIMHAGQDPILTTQIYFGHQNRTKCVIPNLVLGPRVAFFSGHAPVCAPTVSTFFILKILKFSTCSP